MIDLRNYADLIRQLVADENEKDPNWKWSVKSIGKDKVRIRWGYLDYLEEKDNCFILEMGEVTLYGSDTLQTLEGDLPLIAASFVDN